MGMAELSLYMQLLNGKELERFINCCDCSNKEYTRIKKEPIPIKQYGMSLKRRKKKN